jgi:hypothetical protein
MPGICQWVEKWLPEIFTRQTISKNAVLLETMVLVYHNRCDHTLLVWQLCWLFPLVWLEFHVKLARRIRTSSHIIRHNATHANENTYCDLDQYTKANFDRHIYKNNNAYSNPDPDGNTHFNQHKTPIYPSNQHKATRASTNQSPTTYSDITAQSTTDQSPTANQPSAANQHTRI